MIVTRFCCALLIMTCDIANTATAGFDRMTVRDSGYLGSYGSRYYQWVTADMHGTVQRDDDSVGTYRVPVLLMYPDKDSNGFGFVDVVNTAPFAAYTDANAPEGKRTVYYAGDMIFSDYLRREGFTYIGVMAQRMVTFELGADYGVIENALDGYNIILDAASYLKKPTPPDEELTFQQLPVKSVIGFGHSHTAGTLRYMVQSGMNRTSAGELFFDGIIAGVPAACFPFDNDESPRTDPGWSPTPDFLGFEPCNNTIPDDGKFISIKSETELRFPPNRPEQRNYRQYEIAGVAHIPPDITDVRYLGAPRQNPITFKPAFKAARRNMTEWIAKDIAPPDSLYLSGKTNADGKFQLDRDTDGNAIGGLRLPHMPASTDTMISGAPLGTYTGIDTSFARPFNLFPFLAGTFTPFSADAISQRYPTKNHYLKRVKRSADALLAARVILPEDHRTYVKQAEYWLHPNGTQ